ncbi:MAG: thiol reductant ABC exporter subunit CydC [Anaerolineae bacterium]
MSRDPLVRVLKLLLPFWRGVLLAILLGTLTIVSSISLMALSAWLISTASLQPSIAELSVAVVGVRFFGIARAVFRYLERLVSHETTFRLLAEMRVAFYQRIEPLAPARLTSRRSGDLLSRAVSDIESLQSLLLRGAGPPLTALITVVLLTLFLCAFDPLIAAVALAFMLAAGIVLPLLTVFAGGRAGAQRVQARADLNAALVDAVQGMAETLVYGQQRAQQQQIAKLSAKVAQAERQISRIDALQAALMALFTNGAAVIVLAAAVPRIDGVFLATVTLATIAVFEAFMPLSQAALQLGAARSAAARLFEIGDLPPAVNDPPAASAPISASPMLSLSRVSFRYAPDSPPVLDNVSLTLAPGQRIAILGESGSGKSTLVTLLLRFWDYNEGSIRLGDHELREYAQEDVRAVLGVMSQRTHLFNTTIRDNIHIARTSASLDEVEIAAQQAQIHDFILSLPLGYDTIVGEDGYQLSGGERQRIALARVLLKDAPILILDEPTANLDVITERAVLESIFGATQGKSLLMFTHRRVLLDHMNEVYQLQYRRLIRLEIAEK